MTTHPRDHVRLRLRLTVDPEAAGTFTKTVPGMARADWEALAYHERDRYLRKMAADFLTTHIDTFVEADATVLDE